MGSFISQDLPSRGPASEKETLKGAGESPTNATPTDSRSKRDGRSYKEVVRSGPETSAMSKLRESSSAWEFCKAPEDKQMQKEEPVPQQSGDRKGTG